MQETIESAAQAQVFVVMATYNGAVYLRQQIESIRAQSFTDWALLVRDDGSTDDTVSIVQEFSELDERIELIRDELGNLGPSGCFGQLMDGAFHRGAQYVACSDQDDVWLPEKLQSTLAEMQTIEAVSGYEMPVLVASDLEVVDQQLNRVNPSFMQFEKICDARNPSLATLLVQNHVVGCTMMANRSLLELSLPIPPQARMHDWWLALCASATGDVRFLPVATIKYRQHLANTLGASGFSHIYHFFKRAWWRRLAKRPRLHKASIEQAQSLRDRLWSWRQARSEPLESLFICLECRSGIRRMLCARQSHFRGQNWVTTLFFYLFLFFDYPIRRRVASGKHSE